MKNNLKYGIIYMSILIAFILTVNEVYAQGTKIDLNSNDYIAKVYTSEGKTVGPIVGVQDKYLEIRNLAFGKYDEVVHIESIDIDKIKVYRKGRVGRGLILGGLGGALFGAALGLASGDDPESEFISFKAEDKALVLGAFFAIPGTIIGGILGTKKIVIPIKNKHQNYVQKKNLISKYKKY